jgi:hypothetical protein
MEDQEMLCEVCNSGLQIFIFAASRMGYKWKMIAIDKKESFTFCKMSENVRFLAYAFKICKKCQYDPKSFGRKLLAKNCSNFEFFGLCTFFHYFLLKALVQNIWLIQYETI